jgi:hypothetical protein
MGPKEIISNGEEFVLPLLWPLRRAVSSSKRLEKELRGKKRPKKK